MARPAPVRLDVPAGDWRRRAACAAHDPELWFSRDPAGQARAAAICRSCPVRVRCQQWADDQGEIHGAWGGETQQARRERLFGTGSGRPWPCQRCGQQYRPWRSGQRYCSRDCHRDAQLAAPGHRCGTLNAARRHRRRKEPLDGACRRAESEYHRARNLARREKAVADR